MHGRLKVRTTEEQQALKAKARSKKLALYKEAMSKIMSKRQTGELDDEMLQISQEVLLENPDIYTLWNIRKDTLLVFKETKPEQFDQQVEGELRLTERCIIVNPKSYNSWFHREWVINHATNIDFGAEISLCDKCLELDERNFHCWDYRRKIVAKSETTPENELKFSTSKIMKNFSNYSSWHYRSELLPRVYSSPNDQSLLDEKTLSEECNFVQNAIFTDPYDQSAWFYHRWLLFGGDNCDLKSSLVPLWQKELESCRELYSLEENNKWVMLQMCELLRRIGSPGSEGEVLKLIERLIQVDPLRKGYYADYESRIPKNNEGE